MLQQGKSTDVFSQGKLSPYYRKGHSLSIAGEPRQPWGLGVSPLTHPVPQPMRVKCLQGWAGELASPHKAKES